MAQLPVVEKFGQFALHKKIGEGGMAEVFLATDTAAPPNSPPVVIKRLHNRLEKDREAVDLFLTEADVTLMMSHPNVIRVFDAGEIGERYFICMEYVQGKDLEQLWERFRSKNAFMDPYAATYVMIEILKGLQYVHEAKTPSGRPLGVVHRDVTPSNIYVSGDGKVKLGDFGVAKLVGVEGWTMAGSLKGKLGYLAPEQVTGEPPAQSIDLWAAAVIFYEMLSGERAFIGENELDVMLRIKAAKIPKLRKVNKAAPKALEKILKRAFHKKPKKRFKTAGEMLVMLEDFSRTGQAVTNTGLVQYLTKALS